MDGLDRSQLCPSGRVLQHLKSMLVNIYFKTLPVDGKVPPNSGEKECVRNGGVFEKDDTNENKEDKDKKEDAKADQPRLVQPPLLLVALLTHLNLRIAKASSASPALL